MEPNKLPLVVIVGPTASGKTGLAIELAKRYGGEIISADSRAIYKGVDIGSAKPTQKERQGIPHWGLDLINPDKNFTASDFKQYSNSCIAAIQARGHIPFLVGGTGLYIDSVIFDYQFPPKSDDKIRQRLESMTLQELHEYCQKNNIILPENERNKRYVVNNILRNGAELRRRDALIGNTIVVGITTEKNHLRTKIALRVEQMVQHNVVQEANDLAMQYGWDIVVKMGNAYQLAYEYQKGNLTERGLKDKMFYADWHLAKRQLTWLKRNPYITWCDLNSVNKLIARELDCLNHS